MTGPSRTRIGIDKNKSSEPHIQQIEYLLHQSTLGVHFLFDQTKIGKILGQPTDEQKFFTLENMARVQTLLTKFIECPTITEKQIYLGKLNEEEYELIVRAYFHLVENTILANSNLRH